MGSGPIGSSVRGQNNPEDESPDVPESVEKIRLRPRQDSSGFAPRRHRKRELNISLNRSDYAGQVERLASRFGMDDSDAAVFEAATVAMVEKRAEQMGKEWSDEVVEAVANLLVSMYFQETEQRRIGGNGPD